MVWFDCEIILLINCGNWFWGMFWLCVKRGKFSLGVVFLILGEINCCGLLCIKVVVNIIDSIKNILIGII